MLSLIGLLNLPMNITRIPIMGNHHFAKIPFDHVKLSKTGVPLNIFERILLVAEIPPLLILTIPPIIFSKNLLKTGLEEIGH